MLNVPCFRKQIVYANIRNYLLIYIKLKKLCKLNEEVDGAKSKLVGSCENVKLFYFKSR